MQQSAALFFAKGPAGDALQAYCAVTVVLAPADPGEGLSGPALRGSNKGQVVKSGPDLLQIAPHELDAQVLRLAGLAGCRAQGLRYKA